ncbi:MAG: twin-arginine translocation signal domain-containing protein, partial [Fimbriimonadales bacterium]
MEDGITRRDFLQRSGAVVVGLAAPGWLGAFAREESQRALQGRKPASNRVLVVCQLSGGNDGLNTLVPFRDPRYASLRPTL